VDSDSDLDSAAKCSGVNPRCDHGRSNSQVRSGQESQTRANRGPRIGIGASLQKERDTGKLTTEGSAMKRLPARLQVMSVEVAVIDENIVRGVDISPRRDQILKQVCSISNCPIEGSGTMLPHSEILCK
jgi:hypothetical protein